MDFSERKTLGPILQAKDSVLLIHDLWIVPIFFCLPSHTFIDCPFRHLLRGKTWSWSRWQQILWHLHLSDILSETWIGDNETQVKRVEIKLRWQLCTYKAGLVRAEQGRPQGQEHSKKLCSELRPIQELFTQPRDLKLNGESMSSVRKSLQLPSSKGSKINRINTSWSQLVARWPAWRRGMPEIASWGCSQPCISRK